MTMARKDIRLVTGEEELGTRFSYFYSQFQRVRSDLDRFNALQVAL